jgi:cobalt-zinc-cadmium efflux system outer membrane protein
VPVAAALPNPELGYIGYSRTRGDSTAINRTQHQAQLEQPLLVLGQRGARKAYASSLASLAERRMGVHRLEAVRRARHAFVTLLSAQRRTVILAEQERALHTVFDVVSKRAAAGAQSAYDALRIEVELAQLSSRLQQAQAAEQAASTALALELGRRDWEPRAEGELSFSALPIPATWEQVRRGLPAVRAAEQSVRASHLSIGLARAERRPVPSLTAGGYWTTGGDSASAVFGVAIPLPVWNTGKPAIEAAEAVRRAAELAQHVVEVQAETQLGGAIKLFQATREAFEIYERGAIVKLPRLREMADASYKAGAASILVLLDARRSTTDVELGRLEVLEAALHAETEVLAAAGAL